MPPRIPCLRPLLRPVRNAVPRFVPTLPKSTTFSTTPIRSFGLRPKRVSSSGSPHLLTDSRAAALPRRQLPTRSGVLAFKKGMTAVYLPDGTRVPCTVLQLDRVQVTGIKDVKNHGYWAVQVGLGWRRPANISRPMLGHYENMGVAPKKMLKEFRVAGEEGLLKVGEEIKADHFRVGQFVDVRADSKGKGFAGGMKRYGWGGQPASHGNSLTHRAMGSAGQSQGGGSRVLPGKRMAGRMGGIQHTIQNLEVMAIQPELGVVVVKGNVSGPKGCIVQMQDAIKKPFVEKATA